MTRFDKAGCASALLLAVSASNATTISVDFGSLPSTQGQGWVFEHSPTGSHAGTTEAGMFNLSSGVLNIDTVGSGYVSPSGAGYNNYTPISDALPWELSWSSRILQLDHPYTRPTYAPPWGFWGAYTLVNDGTVDVAAAYGDEGVLLIDGSATLLVAMDIFEWHDYKLTFTPGGEGAWEFFVDAVSVATGSGRYNSRVNSLGFGDGTGAANAEWELSAYTFVQNEPLAVPVPSALLLMAVGLAGLRRRA